MSLYQIHPHLVLGVQFTLIATILFISIALKRRVAGNQRLAWSLITSSFLMLSTGSYVRQGTEDILLFFPLAFVALVLLNGGIIVDMG